MALRFELLGRVEAEVPGAGMLTFWPTLRRLGLTPGLAARIDLTLTPLRLAMAPRVSPFWIA